MPINPLRLELANVLRHELMRNRVKQNALAEYLSVTPSAISQLLQGKITPSLVQLNRICELLHLDRHRTFELRCLLSKIRCGGDAVQSPLGELLARYRRERGLTVEALAAASNLPAANIQMIESTPNSMPDVADLRKLSATIGCPEEEIFAAAGLSWRVQAHDAEPIRNLGGLCLREPAAAYDPGSATGVIATSMKYREFWKRLNAFGGDLYANKVAEAARIPTDRPLELMADGRELDLAGCSAWKLTVKSLSTLCAGELALVRFRHNRKVALLVLDNSRTTLVGRKLFRKSNKALQLSEETFDVIIPVESIDFIPHGRV